MVIKTKNTWLITWERIGKQVSIPKRIAAILNYRYGGSYVKKVTERLYTQEMYSPSELFLYTQSTKNNPYPASYGEINGIPWHGQVYCGHNPFLFARRVNDLEVIVLPSGEEDFKWEEIPSFCNS
jgi:hypothetical protein